MKWNFIAAGVCACWMSCLAQASWDAGSDHGGISGGGGNLLSPTAPDHPGDPRAVRAQVYDADTFLRTYLEDKQTKFAAGTMTAEESVLFAPVFNTHFNITHALRDTRVHIDRSGPCYVGRTPVDGSAKLHDEREICISAYNIAVKVRADEIPAQSAGLLLHEYSEVTGTTDEQAVALQTYLLKDLK